MSLPSETSSAMELETGHPRPDADLDLGRNIRRDPRRNPNPKRLSPAATFNAKLRRAFKFLRPPPGTAPEDHPSHIPLDMFEGWRRLPVRYVRGRIRNRSAPMLDALEETLQKCPYLSVSPMGFFTEDDSLIATFWASFHASVVENTYDEAPEGTPIPNLRQSVSPG